MRLTHAAMVSVLLIAGTAAAVLDGVPPQRQRPYLFPPQELGLLESPDRDGWQRPNEIMDALNIADGSTVADFGAGGGWFAIRLARRVGPNGRVYAVDFRPPMIDALERRVVREGLSTVVTVVATPSDARLPPRQVDSIVVVNSYGALPAPVPLLRSLARSLRPSGRLGIVDFVPSGGGPGPPLRDRIDPARVVRDARAAGLRLHARVEVPPYQYLLVLGR